jgi:hypothetical protein
MPPRVLEAALEHLQAGWSVIPCGADKKPLGTWAKYQAAPMDNQEARTRFSTAPALAVVCGAVSKLSILDFEAHSLELPEVLKILELAKTAPRAKSGGGGVHLFFAHSSERNKPLVLNGVHIGDVRGEGGYIVLPPSAHPSGNTYQWEAKPDGDLEPIPVAIQQILEGMGKPKALEETTPSTPPLTVKASSDDATKKYVLAALGNECVAVRNAPEGMGNHQINLSAFALGQLVGAGVLSESEARAGLENAVNSWANPDPSAQASITSGIQAGKLEARDMSHIGQQPQQRSPNPQGKPKTTGSSETKPVVLTETWRGGFRTYGIERGVIVEVKKEKNAKGEMEEYTTALCNFQANIEADTIRDDGAEQVAIFKVSGSLATGEVLPTKDIPAALFTGMTWVSAAWASRAVVYSGQATKDILREAIQLRGVDSRPSSIVYSHTGWRYLEPHGWFYLHAAGGIGQHGNVPSMQVQLTGNLEKYALPVVSLEKNEISNAVRKSLGVLKVAPYHLTLPLWLATYRAVIDAARFTVFLYGRTGSRKSGLAALLLQHLNPSAHWDSLTSQWSATDNALERLLFEAKDSLSVIDDFNPTGSSQDVRKYHARAERVLRAQGNGGGRSRMRADLTLRPEMPPRGLTLATGEDLPHGHSLRARCLILEVKQGDVNLDKLIELSKLAREGVFAHAMSAFLQWLATDLEQHRTTLKNAALEAQQRFSAAHGRTNAAAGELLATWQLWQAFALEHQHITQQEGQALEAKVFKALELSTKAQAAHQQDSDPTQRFALLLRGLLFSGKAHLCSAELEDEPNEPHLWGWRQRNVGTGENQRSEWQAQGQRIGWVTTPRDNTPSAVYLEPSGAYSALCKYASDAEESITKTQRTYWGELGDKGLIFTEDGHTTVKKTVNGQRSRVLHLTQKCIQAVLEGENAPNTQNTKNLDPYTSHISGLSGQEQFIQSPTQNIAPRKMPRPEMQNGAQAKRNPETESRPENAPKIETGRDENGAQNQAVTDDLETVRPESPEISNIGGSGFLSISRPQPNPTRIKGAL